MYRLYKITKDDKGKEVTSRDEYTDVNIAEGNFDFQKGLAMEEHKLTFLMLINNTGEIHKGDIAKIGDGTFSPRLYEVKTLTDGKEEPKSYPHDTAYDVSADFYKRMGGAKQNTNVRAEMLRGIDENGSPLEYEYWVRIPEDVPDEPVVEPTEG